MSTPTDLPVPLRDPAHQVSPRAVAMWRTTELATLVVETAVIVVLYFVLPSWPWWASLIAGLSVVGSVISLAVSPGLRYRIHRWEVTDEAICTRTGWFTTELRIAPLNRVQTVDSHQGPVMRLFGLAEVTVTTASAAGPVSIPGLDLDVAHEVVARLTAITAASESDAT
ncbi:PH domain-containing protein [Nocardioides daejeonensis]|uniref:PH domain-containing protein n=1 Tax=Nocardioides daejeonensis TaxID=1046556 RepID=UPI001EF5294D|nr:PH domain-containing protein [Nocardioides daejeonensis]